ncbi:MAG: electron transfer flavoprotein subunit alpha/FixB family protein [Chloroflexota bacterium]
MENYLGVWTFAEQRDGRLSEVSLELLSWGRRIASQLQTDVSTVLLGHGVGALAAELFQFGANRVYLVDSPTLSRYQTKPYSAVVGHLVSEYHPEVFLFGATALSRDLAPRVACALNIGLSAHCVDLKVDVSTRQLLQVCPFFDWIVTIVSETRPQMATVLPGSARPLPRDDSHAGEVVRVVMDVPPPDVRVLGVESVPGEGESRLEEAEAVVGVGRGVEDGGVVRELAKILGAEVGGTMPAVDAGLVPESRMIGQTGKVVRPKLYLACGISGANQHTVGMQDSGFIVSINKDERAPIFRVSDIGIVGDVGEVVPALVRALSSGH